jgi:hypothetical protein
VDANNYLDVIEELTRRIAVLTKENAFNVAQIIALEKKLTELTESKK